MSEHLDAMVIDVTLMLLRAEGAFQRRRLRL